MSRKLALIIGNSEYEDKSLAQLATPDVDVEALAEVLRDPEIGAFDEVVALVNQPATSIRREVARFFAERGRDDLLLLYFSGHGIRDDRGQLFLAVKDTEHKLLRGTAIPAAYITDEMDNSRSRRQVLILDCCHSGAFAHGMKGAPGASVGTATAFEGTGSGRVVLTATDSTQYAWEGDRVVGQAENSVFTRHLIQGLRTGAADTGADGQITLDELYDYVYDQVVHETPMQKPGKWSYGQQGEIVIARNPRPVVKPVDLPHDLQQSLVDPRPWVREGAVSELDRLLRGGHPGLALAAREALQHMAEDDSRRVANAAVSALAAYEQARPTLEETKAAEKARLAAERKAARQAEKERLAREKAEAERKAKEEAERLAFQRTEQERLTREKAEAEHNAKEKGERLASQRAEQVQLNREKTEAEHKTQETAGTPTLDVRRQIGTLPRWIIWAGLLLVGGLIVGIIANRAANSAGRVNRTATQPAVVDTIVTKTLSAESHPTQPTHTSPALISLTNTPSIQPTTTSLGLASRTNTPPPPVLTRTPTKTSIPLGRIAFVSDRDGNTEIYVMNADGSKQTRLTDNPGIDSSPTWSPDGTRIAFTSNRDSNWEIYVMNADGTDQTRLTDNLYEDLGPAWSPDGSRILFTSNRSSGNGEIYLMNPDGSLQTPLTNSPGFDRFPAWSPDGTRIAFEYIRGPYLNEIYVINADGSGLTRLTENSEVDDGIPAWSPDGKRITFLSNRDGTWGLYVMNADGSQQNWLAKGIDWYDTHNWSPDGTRIAFECDRAICVMNSNGSQQIELVESGRKPAWSPDSARIAFTQDSTIYVINTDGLGKTLLTRDGEFPVWQPLP